MIIKCFKIKIEEVYMKKIISVLLGFLIFFVSPFIVSAKTVTPNELVEHTKNGDLYKMFTEVEGVKWDITYDEVTKKNKIEI